MAKRLRKTRDSFLDKRAQPPLGEALRGDLAQMSLATVLALLEMERRSGQLQVAEGDTADRKGTAKATIDLASGFATGGTLGGASSGLLQILREIMKWKSGLLTFHVGPEAPPPNPKRPIGAILMEAVQLNATGPTPPQLVAKMAAARAAMQKSNSVLPKSPSVVPRGPSLLPEGASVLPKAPAKASALPTKAFTLPTKASALPTKASALPKAPSPTKVVPPPIQAKTPPGPKKQ